MSIVQSAKNYFSPIITSRIIQGAFYIQAIKEITEQGLLLSPAMNLSPAHVNCARIVFPYSAAVMNKIETICENWNAFILLDSINTYGLEGHPILK